MNRPRQRTCPQVPIFDSRLKGVRGISPDTRTECWNKCQGEERLRELAMNERRHLGPRWFQGEMGHRAPAQTVNEPVGKRLEVIGDDEVHSHLMIVGAGVTSMLVMASILTATDTFRRR